jgi:hypothetical protein
MSEARVPAAALVKAVSMVLGLVLSLAALNVVPLDPRQINTSRAVVFATGALMLVLGLLGFLYPDRGRHPLTVLLTSAILATCASALVWQIAIESHDERLAIGSFAFTGPTVEALGKLYVGTGAVFLTLVAAWCWRASWRGVRRRRPSR